jgi:tRNA 2-thiouridine synthesizing protein E
MNQDFDTDEEGFLEDPGQWTEVFARRAARDEGIELTDKHWELIYQARVFYETYGFSPSMRPLVKFVGMNLGPDKGRSIYLMKHFPPSPARLLSRLAGLHKPKNCL